LIDAKGQNMAKLLEQAISELEPVPDNAQDAIDALLLSDFLAAREWTARFTSPLT